MDYKKEYESLVEKLVEHDDIVIAMLKHGIFLDDMLSRDNSVRIKKSLIKNGIVLDDFKNEPDYNIRKEVARIYPEQFVNDASWHVRKAAATNPQYAHLFLKDENSEVRASAVSSCRLEEITKDLACDRSHIVRCAVANRGCFLDILCSDTVSSVIDCVAQNLTSENVDEIREIVERKCIVSHNNREIYEGQKLADILLSRGLGAEMLINSTNEFVRASVAEFADEEIAKSMVNDKSEMVRLQIARRGLCLKQLSKDRSEYVRAEVASNGYILPEYAGDCCKVRYEIAKISPYNRILVYDPIEYIRIAAISSINDEKILCDLTSDRLVTIRKAVAEASNDENTLKQLINDECAEIRLCIAKRGFCLNELAYDKSAKVRMEVAKHNACFDVLRNDKNTRIREYVRNQEQYNKM